MTMHGFCKQHLPYMARIGPGVKEHVSIPSVDLSAFMDGLRALY